MTNDSKALERANKFIAENKHKVNTRYKPVYHLTPETGWINDPNGFSLFGGKVHLFYQYNPFRPEWDTMYWGHATTTDFVKWEYLPVALAPDEEYDKGYGCFSGSAYSHGGKLHLMYTGVDIYATQQQCIAVSEDGIHFEKYAGNPVIGAKDIPEPFNEWDFRDPYLFKRKGVYYCLIGGKTNASSNIAVYKSDDLKKWEYMGPALGEQPKIKGCYECPTITKIDGVDVLMFGAQFYRQQGDKFANVHPTLYTVGTFDEESGRFKAEHIDEIDSGFDFYAPQMLEMPDGRTVMTAWMQMWDRYLPTRHDGWVGAMILPREISVKNGKLIQNPVRELENYRRNKTVKPDLTLDCETRDICSGDKIDISFTVCADTAAKAGIKLFCGKESEVCIYYDKVGGKVVVDRGGCGALIKGAPCETDLAKRQAAVELENGKLGFRILTDKSSVEVFVNGGETVFTANVYPPEGANGIRFFAEGGKAKITDIVKYDVVV